MKRAFLVWMAVAGALVAAPVGNTAAPELIKKGIWTSAGAVVDVRTGYEGDFVADGRLKQKNSQDERVDSYEQDTNSGSLTLNLQDRMDLYALFGSSRTQANWRFTNPADEVVRITLDTERELLWTAGARAILLQWCSLDLGCGGGYSFCQNRLASLAANGVAAGVEGVFLRWREWQVHADLSYKIRILTPYLGVKYSNVLSELKGSTIAVSAEGSRCDLQNRDLVGFFVGCSVSNGSYVFFNVEGRLVDEEAVTFTADLRF